MMAAEELGIPYDKVRADHRRHRLARLQRPHRRQPRHLLQPAWRRSRPRATRSSELCARAAKIWEHAGRRRRAGRTAPCEPAGANAGKFEPLSLKEIAAHRRQDRRADRRPLRASTPTAPAPSFGTHICDVEVDPETGRVDGPALHGRPGRRQGDPPELRRGPVPGRRRAGHRLGAQRGVHLRRRTAGCRTPGFLDYRMPVASDLPMIDTVIVEVPNPQPSLRRARRRRDADRAAAGGDRQRDRATPPASASPSCRCRRPRCSRRSTRPAPRARRRSNRHQARSHTARACACTSFPIAGKGASIIASRTSAHSGSGRCA